MVVLTFYVCIPIRFIRYWMEALEERKPFAGTLASVNSEICIRKDAYYDDLITATVQLITVHTHIGKRDLGNNPPLLFFRQPKSFNDMCRMPC